MAAVVLLRYLMPWQEWLPHDFKQLCCVFRFQPIFLAEVLPAALIAIFET